MEPQTKKKYVGIVMCESKSTQLYPLTKNYPAGCLPVGNKKLIIYALQQLENVPQLCKIIVLYEQCNSQIVNTVQNQFIQCHPQFRLPIQFYEVKDNQQDFTSLQQFITSKEYNNKYKEVSGTVFMPIDTISSVSVGTILELHKQNKSDLTLLLKVKKQYSTGEKKPQVDFEPDEEVDIGLINRQNQIISLDSMTDYEYRGFKLSQAIYKDVSNASFSKLIDSHIYVFSHNIIKIIKNLASSEVQNIKMDFIPMILNNKNNTTLLNYISESYRNPIKIYAKVAHQNEYIRRIFDTKIYEFLNLQSLTRGPKQKEALMPNKYTDEIDQKYMNEYKGNLFGAGTQIEQDCKLRRVCIGKGCKIGKNVQILGSVILNNVTIEQGAKITDCLIGPNCNIGSKAHLSSCQLAKNSQIGNNCKNQSEIILPMG